MRAKTRASLQLCMVVVAWCVVVVNIILVAFIVVVVDSTWQRKLKELVAVNGAKIECFCTCLCGHKTALRELRKMQQNSVILVVHFWWLQLLITCQRTAHITGATDPRCGCCRCATCNMRRYVCCCCRCLAILQQQHRTESVINAGACADILRNLLLQVDL